MLAEVVRASTFVPDGLDAASWEHLQPLYDLLIARELHCRNCLERLILDRSELDAAAAEDAARLYIAMTCRTDDPAAQQAYLDHVEHVQPRLKEAAFALDRKIAGAPQAADLDPTRYGVLLRNLRNAVRLFRPDNIPLETELAKLDQHYSQTCGRMTVHFDGREQTIPQMARYNDLTDRAVREAAWRAVADRRLRDAAAIDDLYDQMLALRSRLAANAGFPDYRAYAFASMRRFEYTPDDCHRFAEGVERHAVPLLRRLAEQRSSRMGVHPLRPWDGQVDPRGRPPLRPFQSTDQLIDGVSRIFHAIDPALGELFNTLRQPVGGMPALDLDSRKGKAPGGYQSGLPRLRRPFIFMNAAGVERDVEVLLHEGGHAFHTLLTREEPLLAYREEIPLEFCEVASMTMELAAHPFLTEFYSSADATRARRNHLEGIIASLGSIAMVDQFQHWIYTHPGHSPADRTARWAQLVARFGPGFDWSGLEHTFITNWQRILHLFGIPFYYIEYGIAQLGALQLWSISRADPAGAIAHYKRGLTVGGSRPLPEIFRAAGLPFDFGPATIERCVREVESALAALPD